MGEGNTNLAVVRLRFSGKAGSMFLQKIKNLFVISLEEFQLKATIMLTTTQKWKGSTPLIEKRRGGVEIGEVIPPPLSPLLLPPWYGPG